MTRWPIILAVALAIVILLVFDPISRGITVCAIEQPPQCPHFFKDKP